MPRRSGGSGFGRSSSRSQTPPPRQATTQQAPPKQTPPPQQAQQAPPQQQAQSGGMFSGLGSTLMTGMAFGAGSEIAHQAVRGIMGSGSGNKEEVQQQQVQQVQEQPQQLNVQNTCSDEQQNFARCLQQNNDISACQTYVDMLKECQNRK